MTDQNPSALKNVTDKIGLARDQVIVGVADAVNSGVDAARAAKEKVGESVDSLIDQGQELVANTTTAIRKRPWATVGIALATGYLIARLTRRR